ncbi:MFS transporter [Halomonas sp. CS7]|uniref:MFS transporter n=1 Tax=Halomonas pelophila TaxID=3151122 RepID=A0ABV1N5V9_9GAMM
MKSNASAWCQVFVAFWIQAIGIGSLVYAYGVVAVPLAEAFQPSRMLLMLGMAAMTLCAGLYSPWLGARIDHSSLRRLMAIGVVAIAAGYLLLSWVGEMWQVPVIYALLMSFGYATLGPLFASTLLSRWFSQRRGLALGIAGMGTSFGGFCFPPLIQLMVETYEWRTAFRLLALIIVAVGLPVVLLLTSDHHARKRAAVDPDRPVIGPVFDSTQAVLGNRNFWLIALSVGVLFAVFTATASNLVPFAVDHGIEKDRAALLIALVAVLAVPGTLIFGALADHLDLRAALAMLMSLIAVGLLCLLNDPPYAMMVVGSLLVGLGGGGMIPVWGALLAKVFGLLDYGRVMGLMNPVLMLFTLVAPPLAGYLHDLTGSYDAAFLGFAVPLVAVILLLPLIRFSAAKAIGEASAQPS